MPLLRNTPSGMSYSQPARPSFAFQGVTGNLASIVYGTPESNILGNIYTSMQFLLGITVPSAPITRARARARARGLGLRVTGLGLGLG